VYFDLEFQVKDYKEITELSETLNHTTKELAKTEVLQRELIANVSHDLRTPLTMITAYSEVMRDIPGENTPENVQVIIDETKRLTVLVNDLLDMSKIQAGVTVLETKEYDLTESISASIERHSKLLEPYGYKVMFEYDCHVLVEADEFKIYQVIYNLIGNAVNYAGDDKTVKVRQIVKNGKVRIEVIDRGEGIPKDKLENVWDRYYKLDKNHKRAIMGSGLGLSIVQNILKLHNAQYGVESTEGEGSVFWFELKVTVQNE
jgi:signal transduction histidine kinase